MDFDTDIRPAQIIQLYAAPQVSSRVQMPDSSGKRPAGAAPYGLGVAVGTIIGIAGAGIFVAWIIKLVLERWS